MTRAAPALRPITTLWRMVGLGLGGAGLALGAAVLWGGPDPELLPQMADRPVPLPEGRRIFVQRHEVTIAEWNRCAAAGECALTLQAMAGMDPQITPATGLSYVDVQAYVVWISAATGHPFRLPTATEWRVMAAEVLPEAPAPLFTDPALSWAFAYQTQDLAPRALKPQGSFSVSPEGVADLDGSVWEWTQECYAEGFDAERCPAFYVGGEHLAAMSYLIRDPARGGCAVGAPPAHLGLRLVTQVPL